MNCKKEKYAKKIAKNTVLDKAQGMEILKDSERPKRDSKFAISLSKDGKDWVKIRGFVTAINK